MDVDSFQKISLAEAQSHGLDAVLQKIVQSLADNPDIALTRIWLIGPGDLCASCAMKSMCPDQTRCLHLVASAGKPLKEQGRGEAAQDEWSRINGHFRRIPLNAPFKVSHVATMGGPIHIRMQEGAGAQLWISRMEWVEAQRIRSFAGLPIIFHGEVLGVLAVFSRVELSDRELGWLQGFAERAAEAISKVETAGQVIALRTSVTALEERWRSVFERSAIGVAFSDERGRFLDVNPAYQKILGYSEQELRKLSFYDITPDEFRESNRSLATELWTGRTQQYQFEKPYRRKDGSLVWVLLHASLVPGTGNVPRFAMALCEDITERKQAEDSLRKSEERRRTLLEINNAIITKLSQHDLFHAICEALKRVVPYGRVALILRDPGTNVLRIAALEGPFQGKDFAVGHEVGPESISRWIIDHRRPFLRRNLEAEWKYPTERLLLDSGIRSLCALPLLVREDTSGVLFLVSPAAGEYSEDDVFFLQDVANQVALAIGNMQAYEEIGNLNKQVATTAEHLRTLLEINNAIVTNLSQEALLRSIAESLRVGVPFDRAALTIYQPGREVFRFVAIEGRAVSNYFRPRLEISPVNNSVGWVFHHQRPILRQDLEQEQQYENERRLAAEGMRSHCVVPLIVRGKSIGTLNVAHTHPGQYSQKNAEFLQEVANQVALAVENMQAYEEIAALKARLEKENIYLQEEIRIEHNFEEIMGNSNALLKVLRAVEQVAPTDSTVLIHGETGTGKELIARAIHNRSLRKERPLVRVDCSSISTGLIESELFGHMKGAFTGASERRTGRFEIADGGTIFLDEIGELPLEMQMKLLRVLQEREFEPMGSSRSLHVDVRVIAATNRTLQDAVDAGRFRSDLFYRLNVFPLELPPLRSRRTDIPLLVNFYLSRYSKKLGKQVDTVSRESMGRLMSYAWPGNVRELQNVIERAVILSPGPNLLLNRELLPGPFSENEEQLEAAAESPALRASEPPLLATLEDVERRHIVAALQETGGVIEGPKGAARILGLHPNTLRHRMQKLGIRRSAHRQP
ncbi:MAG TPA: sigma 54-interacting transcriptional regulator [Terriglobia bacterium]|nr:sigma 54-interacting transcriptional regulator [Terriglobia bacterium]